MKTFSSEFKVRILSKIIFSLVALIVFHTAPPMGSVYFRGLLNVSRPPELTSVYLLEMHHESPSGLSVITENYHYFHISGTTHRLCVFAGKAPLLSLCVKK